MKNFKIVVGILCGLLAYGGFSEGGDFAFSAFFLIFSLACFGAAYPDKAKPGRSPGGVIVVPGIPRKKKPSPAIAIGVLAVILLIVVAL